MKCYEVLYNSSQAMRSGGVGFGIRAQSESMPEEYISAADINVKYNKGKFRGEYIESLLEDTTKILNYPVNLSYFKSVTSSGKELYILRRTIALELDYAYYESGQATRPGNFMEHTLIFDQKPDSSIFNLIYEKPKGGSRYFRPLSRDVNMTNLELKSYMVGSTPDFKLEDLPCETEWQEPISEQAYNLLFYFIEARENNRSLVVKIDDAVKCRVIADLCRLMLHYAADFSFGYTYDETIDTSKFDFIYTTQHNRAIGLMVLPTYDVCEAGKEVESDAAKKYLKLLKEAVESGNRELHKKIIEWLFSGDYKFVEECSSESSVSFFNYSKCPDSFSEYELINQELVKVIARKHNGSSEHQLIHTRIEQILRSTLSEKSYKSFVEAAQLIDSMKGSGINIAPAMDVVRRECTAYIIQSPEQFVEIYNALERPLFESYLDREMLYEKQDYITSEPFLKQIIELYRYLFKDVASSIGLLLSKLLTKVAPDTLVAVLRDANPDATQRMECYLNSIELNAGYVGAIWSVAVADLKNSIPENLMQRFSKFSSEQDFAPLFYYSLLNANADAMTLIADSGKIMECNEAYKRKVVDGERSDGGYRILFTKVVCRVNSSNAKSYAEQISRDVVTPLNTLCDVTNWVLLYNLLSNLWRELKEYIAQMYNIALKTEYNELLEEVAYEYIVGVQDGDVEIIKSVITDLKSRGLLDLDRLYPQIAKLQQEKQIHALGLYFKVQGLKFAEAWAIAEKLSFADADTLFKSYYEAEYKSYCRNKKIKSIFKKIFTFWKRDKK